MQIGNYTLENNVILAPMAGITDSPFRRLCKEMGAGMTVSEMISSNSLRGASSFRSKSTSAARRDVPKTALIRWRRTSL